VPATPAREPIKRYLRALVLFASLLLPGASAVASVLTIADYQGFHDPDLKMLSIGDDLYAIITNQPVTHSPDCLIELAFKFDAVHADLHTVGTLVGVAANMADNARYLSPVARQKDRRNPVREGRTGRNPGTGA
jgi:hypothetical protein